MRILAVDDHPPILELLRRLLAQHSAQTGRELTLCGEADDVAPALELVTQLQPDLTIVDLQLRTGNGLTLLKELGQRSPAPRCLVWSMHDDETYGTRAMRAGALGYVCKREPTRRLLEAIDRALVDEVTISDRLASMLRERHAGSDPSEGVELLSDRELQVLEEIGSGRPTGEIARRLDVSVKTIETHRQRIRAKLHLRNGSELFRFAVEWQLVGAGQRP